MTADFLEVLAAWGTDPGGPPDSDADGIVGITDFLAVLANWGPCPGCRGRAILKGGLGAVAGTGVFPAPADPRRAKMSWVAPAVVSPAAAAIVRVQPWTWCETRFPPFL